eukprot:7386176-Prymnesium_polylepis.2
MLRTERSDPGSCSATGPLTRVPISPYPTAHGMPVGAAHRPRQLQASSASSWRRHSISAIPRSWTPLELRSPLRWAPPRG